MGKRTPEQVWRTAVKEAIEDERDFQRAAGMTPAEAEQELAAMGLDPKAEREKASDWRREIEERVAARKRKEILERERARSLRPERRRYVPAIAWLVAAVAGAAVGGGAVYVAMEEQRPRAPTPSPAPLPTPAPEPVEPAPPELVSAADLRHDAFGECEAREWDACLADLDRARATDPAGDDAPAVKDARKRAIAGIVANKPPKPKLKP
jgi:hypothetical protein